MALKGKTILVTGGAVRVGAAISRSLAADGANVVIQFSKSRAAAEALELALHSMGHNVGLVRADLLKPASEKHLFDRAEALFGPVTGLINNAATILPTPFDDFDIETARHLFELNTLVPMRLTAELVSRKPQHASIVNLADTAWDRAWAGNAAYCASKAALVSATRVAARELAPDIRVNAVLPGTVELREDERDREKAIKMRIPLKRIGTPEQVAEAVAYLLRSSYTTGTLLRIDGGANLT